jgi:endogenous inhibitor of DNA gyrase (YacG/DUF329 family)
MADVPCPICRRKVPSAATTPTYPFCSARCKLVDLGNWLSDSYVIPTSSTAGDSLDDLDEETLAALLREPS